MHLWCNGSSDRSLLDDPLSYTWFQPMLHDWYNKGRCMRYNVCGLVHIKEPLLRIGNSSPCNGGSGFPLWLYMWSFTICPTPYHRKPYFKCVDSDKYLPMTCTMGSLGVAVLLTKLQEDAMSCDSSPEVAVLIRAIYFIVKYVQLYFYYYISLMHHLHVFL